jgi:hypothetical protein
MAEKTYEKEMRRRALAAEGALLFLVDRLATRGVISLNEGEELLVMLSKSCDMSAARVSSARTNLDRLRRLRRGDGETTPGTPL